MTAFPSTGLQSIAEAQATISKGRARLSTAEQELTEIRRQETNDRALKHRADGLPIPAKIREDHRYDWTRRYTAAMAAAEDSEEALEVRFAFHVVLRLLIRPYKDCTHQYLSLLAVRCF